MEPFYEINNEIYECNPEFEGLWIGNPEDRDFLRNYLRYLLPHTQAQLLDHLDLYENKEGIYNHIEKTEAERVLNFYLNSLPISAVQTHLLAQYVNDKLHFPFRYGIANPADLWVRKSYARTGEI